MREALARGAQIMSRLLNIVQRHPTDDRDRATVADAHAWCEEVLDDIEAEHARRELREGNFVSEAEALAELDRSDTDTPAETGDG